MNGGNEMDDDRLHDLLRRVEELEDREAIRDCIARHARGCDRHDVELLTAAYHSDGVDEHGATILGGPEYAGWANATHAATSATHLHHVTTTVIDLDGDTAHAESYVMVTLLAPDASQTTVMCGRYIDRLDRRDGAWRITVRRATVELAFSANSAMLQSPFFVKQGYIRGDRDRSDPSYARPLTLDTPSTRW